MAVTLEQNPRQDKRLNKHFLEVYSTGEIYFTTPAVRALGKGELLPGKLERCKGIGFSISQQFNQGTIVGRQIYFFSAREVQIDILHDDDLGPGIAIHLPQD